MIYMDNKNVCLGGRLSVDLVVLGPFFPAHKERWCYCSHMSLSYRHRGIQTFGAQQWDGGYWVSVWLWFLSLIGNMQLVQRGMGHLDKRIEKQKIPLFTSRVSWGLSPSAKLEEPKNYITQQRLSLLPFESQYAHFMTGGQSQKPLPSESSDESVALSQWFEDCKMLYLIKQSELEYKKRELVPERCSLFREVCILSCRGWEEEKCVMERRMVGVGAKRITVFPNVVERCDVKVSNGIGSESRKRKR